MLYQLVLLASAAIFVGAHTHTHTHTHTHDDSSAHATVPLRGVARLASPDGHDVHGNVTFTQLDGKVEVKGRIYGMPAGEYGFHIHETGDITNGCVSAGAHFNPDKKDHGHPEDENRHVGDLGNVVFDNEQLSNIDFTDSVIALYGPHNIIGRAVVLHAMADDFGRSDHPDSKKTGNAGGRVACGVIGILSPVNGWMMNAASKFVTATIATVLVSANVALFQ
ncbi:superoxide dismutase [Cu-Zn] 4AP-like [Vanessa cardui]|uniref:superoxide dismutase [Cu-Zn] 4AP-like n=1 Tax=Vanessa cardui TaxID=171605 RepID=UPI001F135A76|nr:superoxide dismutase [Cu-Zn] 4AP-like [Vanessa cardui]XP_046964546.1 superoxide dismutase [Cu-Zn] 4AP-like [Vanessa cardui]